MARRQGTNIATPTMKMDAQDEKPESDVRAQRPVASERKGRGSALERAIMALEAITQQAQPVGLADLTERLDLPRATVHRILIQLEDQGLIVRHPIRDRFSIGPRLSRLALAALMSDNQGTPIRAILSDLVAEVGETCNYGVLDGAEFVYLERIECAWPLRVHLQAGSRVPAYCTSGGKAMLANLPDDVRRRLLETTRLSASTPNTIVDRVELESALQQIREDGYALNNEEYTVGIAGVGVPITDREGRVVAALALHGPVARLSVDGMRQHVPRLKEAARRLAQALEYAD